MIMILIWDATLPSSLPGPGVGLVAACARVGDTRGVAQHRTELPEPPDLRFGRR